MLFGIYYVMYNVKQLINILYAHYESTIITASFHLCIISHSLAHDCDGSVASGYLDLGHMIQHLQKGSGGTGAAVLGPLGVLELGHSNAVSTSCLQG